MEGLRLTHCCYFLGSWINVVLLSACCALVLHSQSARSETYTVGDEDKWDTGVNYLSWSTKYTFRVDDILVFQYTKGTHNVYQVTEESYRSCNASSGVLGKYHSGNDQIELTESNKYWFICDISGHCLGGMRFGINVTAAAANNKTTSGSNGEGTDSTLPSSSSPAKSCSSQRGWIYLVIVILVQLLVLPRNS